MPIGKSGNYHMNPHHMRAQGDAPEEGPERDAEGASNKSKTDGAYKDGQHHHILHKHEDGSYTSEHHHPDGQVEHAEHPHFQHALAHQAAKFEESESPEEEAQDDPANDREPDGRANYDDGKAALARLYED